MDILHVGNYHPGASHGVATAIAQLVLAEQAAGLSSAIYSPRSREGLGTADPRTDSPIWTGRWDLTAALAARPRVLHFHYLFHREHQAVYREARRRGLPYVVSTHGALHPRELDKSVPKALKKSAYLALMEGPNLRSAHALRAVTDVEARGLNRRYSTEVRVLANPFVRVWTEATPPARSNRIGFLGRVDIRTKGLDTLCLAAETAAAALGSRVQVAIAGQSRDGSDEAALASLVRDRCPHVDLQLEGVLHGNAVHRFLRSLSVYVHPARWELFGMSILEAFDAAVPAVVSSECDLAPTLHAAGAARVAAPQIDALAEEVVALIRSPHAAETLSRNAAAWLDNLQPTRLAPSIHALYEGT